MIVEMKTLNEYFDISSDGLFSVFNNPIWIDSFQDSTDLDMYFYMRYGDRIGNKFIDKFADSDGEVKGENLNNLANLIYSVNAKKWEHLYKAFMAEYSPIENTDFIETITETTGNTRVVDSDGTSSGTASTTSSGTSSGTNSGANNKFGFNSSAAVGDTTSSDSDSNTTSATSSTTSSGSTTDDSTITDNGTHTSEHRKHGNIGVTEATVMLEHELEFWKWSFIDSICMDICDIIALSIY